MMSESCSPQDPASHGLHRSFGLLQATAMNMSNMVGVGPFLTIPLIITAMNGPQALLGWIAGAVLAICDGLVWAELASAIPSSGGTLEYLKVAYSGSRLGRWLPFLFIWQFVLSGPLEIASGNIGFADYVTYLVPLSPFWTKCLAMGSGLVTVILLYRKIESVGKLMVILWTGVILTISIVLITGARNFNPELAFDFPPDAFRFSTGFVYGLGTAMCIAMYDFLGYYSVCYIGDEVRRPAWTIPRSILISVVVVAGIYMAMNTSFISVVPWQTAKESRFVAAVFMERIYGSAGGVLITLLICWCSFAAVYALMLGYSRILYAAARDGFFFSVFARLHPRGEFPHVALLVLGAISIATSVFSLDEVIPALLTLRILIQFIAQIAAVWKLRRRNGTGDGFRMPLFPLPALVALFGWLFIFATSGVTYIGAAVGVLALGIVVGAVWLRLARDQALRLEQ